MEIGIGWLGVGLGIIGCLAIFGLVGGYKREQSEHKIDWLCAGSAFVITIVFWVIALQTWAFLLLNQSYAFGWLIGGLTGTVVLIASARLISAAGNASLRKKRLAGLFYGFAALFVVSLMYCLHGDEAVAPLMGVATAAVMVGILQICMRAPSSPVKLDLWALYTVTLAVAVIFSIKHFDSTLLSIRWAMPILVALSALLANYVAIELSALGALQQNPGKSYCVTVLISALLLAAMVAVYSWEVFCTWPLMAVVGIGLGIAAAIAWMSASVSNPEINNKAWFVCALLMVAFVTSVFKLWAGLGVAMGLIAAWAVSMPISGETEQTDRRLYRINLGLQTMICFGLAILLYRLFVSEYVSLGIRRSGLHTHYVFITATVGVFLPFLFAQQLKRLNWSSRLSHALAVGIVAAGAPFAMFVCWQLNAVLGLCFGLIMAILFCTIMARPQEYNPLKVGFIAIGAQLVSIQFIKPFLDIELSRAVRGWSLAGLLILAAIYLAFSGLRGEASGHVEE